MKVAGVVLTASVLAGCIIVPPGTQLNGSAADWLQPKAMTVADAEEVQRRVRTPEGRQAAYEKCMSTLPPKETRELMAQVMSVPPSLAVKTFCNRMIDAIASGELTPAEIANDRNGIDHAPMLRVIMRPSTNAALE